MSKRKKRLRIDFTLEEVTPIGEDKGGKYYRFRMVPDKRLWERAEIRGQKGYLNKFDNIFISDKEMAEAVKTMKNIPITISTVDIGTEQEYLEKSKKRVRNRKE